MFHAPSSTRCILGPQLLVSLIRNSMLELRSTAVSMVVYETATKPSPTQIHKRSLGGCIIDTTLSNYHRREHIASPARYHLKSRDKVPVLDHFYFQFPSHRHKRLLIYCRCRYFLIFPLLIVVLVIYSLLKMAAEKGACRKRKWSKTGLSLL